MICCYLSIQAQKLLVQVPFFQKHSIASPFNPKNKLGFDKILHSVVFVYITCKKFRYSKKAAKIDEISNLDLTLKKETVWKLLTCILDEEFVLSEHQGRTTPPPAKKAKQEIVNSSTVSPYWLEFVQYLIFRLVSESKVK